MLSDRTRASLACAGHSWKWAACLALLAGVLCFPQPVAAKPLAQQYDVTRQCFAVADEDANDNRDDTLVRFDRTTGQTFAIGPTGTESLEAITFNGNRELLGANHGQLGTLDLASGAFSPSALPFGTANGPEGPIDLRDVDSLAFDIKENRYYGVHRRGGVLADVLFVFDPVTGAHIPNSFDGGTASYLVIDVITDSAGEDLDDVDDLAIDPVTGAMYAAINNGGRGGVLGQIDPVTGSVTQVGEFRYAASEPLAGEVIDDIEGLAFLNDGQLYASTGDNVSGNPDSNKLFRIDKTNAEGVEVGPFPAEFQDYEALDCLTFQAFIVLDKFTNGPGQSPQDADTPTGPSIVAGDTVTWTFTFTNTAVFTLTDLVLVDNQIGQIGPGGAANCPPAGAILGPGQSMTCTATGTAQEGQYANTGTVTGTTQIGLVTPRQTVTATDPSHYFGLPPSTIPEPAIDIEKATNGEDADTPPGPVIEEGQPVVWTYVVQNTGNVPLENVTVTDNELGPICVIPLLAPGASDTCEANGTAQLGPYANVGTVVGTPTEGPTDPVTDSDPSHYIGVPLSGPVANVIGDFVWLDDSRDGIQDPGEEGISGIGVRLYRDNFDDAPIATTTTDADGRYNFNDVGAGTYCLEFVLVNPLTPENTNGPKLSPADQGDDDTVDSDGVTVVDSSTIRTACFPVAEDTIDLTRDLGLFDFEATGEDPIDQPSAGTQHLYLPHLNH